MHHYRHHHSNWAQALGFVIAIAGCGGGSSITPSKAGQIDVSPATTIEFRKGEVAPGATDIRLITIRNKAPHVSDLSVRVRFEYVAPVEETEGPSLQLVGGDVDAVLQPLEAGGTSLVLQIAFLRYGDPLARSGRLIIESDSQSAENRRIEILVGTSEAAPVANVAPAVVRFDGVVVGETAQKPVTVANTGADDLKIASLLFQAHPDFRLAFGGDEWEPGSIAFDPPIVIAASSVETFVVSFNSQAIQPADGLLVFYTNDASAPSGSSVVLQANHQGPVLRPNPKKLDFGGKIVGTKSQLPVELGNVGDGPLTITEVFLSDSSASGYAIPEAKVPVTIQPNEAVTVYVEYVAQTESPFGADGTPIPDLGSVVVVSDSLFGTVEIPVSAVGTMQEFPVAVAVVQEGEQVIPQTTLHLFGDQSWAPAGAIASYKWTVQQPSGSSGFLVPNDAFPNPTFTANTAGQYVFSLEVWDEQGKKSLLPAEQTVLVVPDEAIHVELLWHTPNDPDETDQGPEAGADLDLHFALVPLACTQPDIDGDGKPDPWFDQPFDTFWFNAHPNWGSFDPSVDDDPGLDLDDTDGAGPENLNLNIPQNAEYQIGVHYWSDHSYGPSLATVRVYIYSTLVFEVKDVQLTGCDMWNVATIEWPSGKVTLKQASDGGYAITPNYNNPFFFQGCGN